MKIKAISLTLKFYFYYLKLLETLAMCFPTTESHGQQSPAEGREMESEVQMQSLLTNCVTLSK